jgi:hypothetical protein
VAGFVAAGCDGIGFDSSMEAKRRCELGVSGKLCALRGDCAMTFTSSLASMRIVVGVMKDGRGNSGSGVVG